MNHPPRNTQGHIGGPSLWADKPADDALPLLEGALREDELSLWVDEYTNDVHSLLRRTPDFEEFWFDYRTLFVEMSFVETSFLSGSTIS